MPGNTRYSSEAHINRVTSMIDGMLKIIPAGYTAFPAASSTGKVPQDAERVRDTAPRIGGGIQSGSISLKIPASSTIPARAP